VSVPQIEIDGCRQAHTKLVTAIADLTDTDVSQPSLLADWTLGHVLARLARHADAMSRRIDAALQGEVVEQYVGCADGRDAEIDAGATRAAHAIVADITSSAVRLDALFASVLVDRWSMLVRTQRCDQRALMAWALGRGPASELEPWG